MSTLTDTAVIVTGGSSGIGRAAALDEAAGDHRNVSAVVADAASPENAVRTVATAVDAHAPSASVFSFCVRHLRSALSGLPSPAHGLVSSFSPDVFRDALQRVPVMRHRWQDQQLAAVPAATRRSR
jgi:NAD(P)-dependent dehydrogenase (short-subunit alcohol dehydrogenase family)